MDLEKGFVVTWDCSNEATSYIIERICVVGKNKSEFKDEFPSEIYRDGNKIIYNDKAPSIKSNSEYMYKITAKNAAGTSMTKETNNAKTGTPPQEQVKRVTIKFIPPKAPSIPDILTKIASSIGKIKSKQNISTNTARITEIASFLKDLKKFFSKVNAPDEVRLTWDSVPRAYEYCIYSGNTLLLSTTSTSATFKRNDLEKSLIYIEASNGWGSGGRIPFALVFDGASVRVNAL